MGPRPRIKLITAAGTGEGKEGGGVTICEDDDDRAVMCVSEDGTTVRCGVTTNFRDEDRNKEGEGIGIFNFFRVFRFLQFCCFFGCPLCLIYAFPHFLFLVFGKC